MSGPATLSIDSSFAQKGAYAHAISCLLTGEGGSACCQDPAK